jgi:hypothetical protein
MKDLETCEGVLFKYLSQSEARVKNKSLVAGPAAGFSLDSLGAVM